MTAHGSKTAVNLDDYNNDKSRRHSVMDEKISPPIHQVSLQHHCPSLCAVTSLLERHFFVMDDFVDARETAALRAEVMLYEKQRRMVEGEIGTAGGGQIKKEVRDDVIHWLEGSEPHIGPMMKRHILRCDVFSQRIQILLDSICPEQSWCGAGRTKIMASLYRQSNAATGADGAKYNPHFDNTRDQNDNGRRLTMILYLNADWKAADGGRLRVKTKTEVADIAPLGGRLVVFWPDERVPHEVLPAKASDRYAITIWYLDGKRRKEVNSTK